MIFVPSYLYDMDISLRTSAYVKKNLRNKFYCYLYLNLKSTNLCIFIIYILFIINLKICYRI